jgi:hypothetical protein
VAVAAAVAAALAAPVIEPEEAAVARICPKLLARAERASAEDRAFEVHGARVRVRLYLTASSLHF